jgi:ADP-ribosylation factor-binding protein GGA
MCEEESDDAEAVSKLLEINDSIHRTIERYKLMKAGNIDAANKIAKGTLGTTTGVGKNASNELSLIDFDPEPPSGSGPSATNGSLLETSATSPASGHTSVEDDLLGLSLDNGPPGMISLGASTTSGAGVPPFSMSSPPPFTAPGPGISRPPQQPSPKPNYDAFAALISALPSSKPATPTPTQQRQAIPSQPNIDPFAALVSSGSRPSTPSQLRNISQPNPQQDPFASFSQPQIAAPAPAAAPGVSTDDDWNFASALPEQPDTSVVQVHSGRIGIDFAAKRNPGQPLINIQARFSNQTQQPISGLHFQVAVEKAYSLQLRPQTGRELAPFQRNAVQQEILLSGVPSGKGSSVKIRFKVSYHIGGESVDEQGNVPTLGIV